MLNLGLIEESCLEIQLPQPSGDILNLLRPDSIMFRGLKKMVDVIKNDVGVEEEGTKALDEFYKFMTTLINHNKEGKKYTQQQIEKLVSVHRTQCLMLAYFEWSNNLLKSPN